MIHPIVHITLFIISAKASRFKQGYIVADTIKAC